MKAKRPHFENTWYMDVKLSVKVKTPDFESTKYMDEKGRKLDED